MGNIWGLLSPVQKLIAGALAGGVLLLGLQALPVSSVTDIFFCNSPEGVLDCVVNSINDRKPEKLVDYVYGDFVSVNLNDLEKSFPSIKKVLGDVKLTISNKEYQKIDDNGKTAHVHVRADVYFQGKGIVGKKVIDFTATIVMDRGKWLVSKESLQGLIESLATLY